MHDGLKDKLKTQQIQNGRKIARYMGGLFGH